MTTGQDPFRTVRQAMAWLHTWFGLVLGFVLMVAFYFGALAVYAQEIDRWTIPALRHAPGPMPAFDGMVRAALESMQPSVDQLAEQREVIEKVAGPLPDRFEVVRYWDVYVSDRDPMLTLYGGYELPGRAGTKEVVYASRVVDPRTGLARPTDELRIGSGLFYPLHFNLTLHWRNLGAWVVGLAALVMMVALISGVVLHRRIFREFFTFRPRKSTQRSALDLHNMTGVLALPFHFFLSFTGVLIFAGIYFPVAETQLRGLHDRHERVERLEVGRAHLPEGRSGVAAPLASVDEMMAQAQARWTARGEPGEVGWLTLHHVGDANGRVSIHRAPFDRVAPRSDAVWFDASSGERLWEDPPPSTVDQVHGFLTGMHLFAMRHWLLRALYLLAGLMGCVCIATGFIFFVEKRRQAHLARGRVGAFVVDALAVTTVTGMVAASLSILVVNRLLPQTLPAGWPSAAQLQLWGFWGMWGLCLAHALLRAAWRGDERARARVSPAWREQCLVIAGLALAAVSLNAVTTGDHLLRTLQARDWSIAGMDLLLLATMTMGIVAARRLKPGRERRRRP